MGSKENWLQPNWLNRGPLVYITLPVILLPITVLFSLPLFGEAIVGVREWWDLLSVHHQILNELAGEPGLNLKNARELFLSDLYDIPKMLLMILLVISPMVVHLLISISCIKAKRATRAQIIISVACAIVAFFSFPIIIS
jgi:hypothetical protein